MEENQLIKLLSLSGKKVLSIYSSGFDEYKKDGGQPVTDADLASNEILTNALQGAGIPILSEESADSLDRLKSKRVWIIDPLDGTSDFISKTGEFSIMVALVEGGQPIQSAIYLPDSGVIYYAEKGRGAHRIQDGKKQRLSVSSRAEYPDMRIFLSRKHLGETEKKLSGDLGLQKVNMGSAGIKLAKIAEGSGEVYINSSDKSSEWDTAAGKLILEEAGGKITDVKGEKINYNQPDPRHLDGYIATNGFRHDDIVRAVKVYEKN